MRPLTKNPDNEQYFEYSPSSGFLPSVALGTLLTRNFFLVIRAHLPPLAKRVLRIEKITLWDPLKPFLPLDANSPFSPLCIIAKKRWYRANTP